VTHAALPREPDSSTTVPDGAVLDVSLDFSTDPERRASARASLMV